VSTGSKTSSFHVCGLFSVGGMSIPQLPPSGVPAGPGPGEPAGGYCELEDSAEACAAGLDVVREATRQVSGLEARKLAAIATLTERAERLQVEASLDGSVFCDPDRLVEVIDCSDRIAAVAGLVQDVDESGRVVLHDEVGSFDWLMRAGRRTAAPFEGLPAFFVPEGAVLIRREAYLGIGGYFEPFFSEADGLDLSTRLIGAGWDVRYVPDAVFQHMKVQESRWPEREYRLRTRNHLWYFWMHFPLYMAVTTRLSFVGSTA
jgi:N-acetylglucosaminyl-diphospho-decaprenol L-rhamnosyltransferase